MFNLCTLADTIKYKTTCSLHIVNPSRDGTGIMFLNEVAIGKQHVITRDDSSLKVAPKGFDSVLAKGRVEPG